MGPGFQIEPVLERARLAFIAVDAHVARGLASMRTNFHFLARGEARAAKAAKAGLEQFLNHAVSGVLPPDRQASSMA